jgi:hypothetical protein
VSRIVTCTIRVIMTSLALVGIAADRVGAAGGTLTSAMLDSSPHPLYTRADVPWRMIFMREMRLPCVPHRLTAGRGDASWAG